MDKNLESSLKIGSILRPHYILVIIFVLFFTILSVNRHYALKSYLHDIGTFEQVIWNTLYGNFFQTTSNLWQTGSYLGDHFSPIFLFFVPFYAIGLKTDFFLFIQSLAVALSGIPIYEIARRKLKKEFYGIFFLAAYFLYSIIHNALLYDFHLISLAAFFLAFAFYFIIIDKKWPFLIFSFLAILCQEEIALIVFTLSLYALFKKRFAKASLFLAIFSLIWFVAVISFVIPYFNESGQSAFSRYEWLGGNIFSVAKSVFLKPFKVLDFLAYQDHFTKYVFNLFFPLAFLPLLSPLILIALPILFANTLSSNLMMSDIFFYHSVAIAPFIFFAAIYSLSRFKKKVYITLIIIISTIISILFFSVTPFSLRYTFHDYRPSQNAVKIENIKKLIPSKNSLSSQHNLGPHFSERQEIYVFPRKAHEADLVLVDLFDPYADNPRQVFNFPYALQMSVPEWISEIEKMFEDENYGIIYWEDGYYLFKRGARQDLREEAFRDFEARKNLFVK